jgi:uncharacterized membrane protein YhhN
MNYTGKHSFWLFALALTGVAGFLTGIAIDDYTLRMITKPLPVLSLLFLLKPDSKFRKLIYIGFLFSLAGDILLETADSLFVFGLGSFLVAHIFYIMAFWKRKTVNAAGTAFLLFIFGSGYYYFLFPDLQQMAIPVLVYIIVILIMVWSSFVQRKYDRHARFAAWGALFFMFSDSLIAYTKFHAPVEYSRYVIIITYWLAQYLIFYSALKEKDFPTEAEKPF